MKERTKESTLGDGFFGDLLLFLATVTNLLAQENLVLNSLYRNVAGGDEVDMDFMGPMLYLYYYKNSSSCSLISCTMAIHHSVVLSLFSRV